MKGNIIVPPLSVNAKIRGPSPECQEATALSRTNPSFTLFFSFCFSRFTFFSKKSNQGLTKSGTKPQLQMHFTNFRALKAYLMVTYIKQSHLCAVQNPHSFIPILYIGSILLSPINEVNAHG